MLSKHSKVWIAVGLLIILFSGVALAAKAKPEPVPVSPVEQDANLANSVAKVLGFSVDVEKVTAWREKNYGYAEMALIFSLSHISRQPSGEIMKMKETGVTWKELAAQLNVSLGKGMDGVSKIMKEMKMSEETDKLKSVIAAEPKPAKTGTK